MKLPTQLVHVRPQLDAAIVDHAIPAEWPEGEKFIRAGQPQAIAQVLIRTLRTELGPAKIAYLFKESMKRGEMVSLGKASKASGASHFLHHYDFVIAFHWGMWKVMSHEQRLALVDHELAHCEFDAEKGFWLRHHDVEDFVVIVDRWGLWTRGLQDLAKAILPTAQSDLFAGTLGDRKVIDALLDQAERGESSLTPEPGSSIESVTILNGKRSVTLTQDPAPLDEPPIRRPRERLVHTKKRPSGRGKAES